MAIKRSKPVQDVIDGLAKKLGGKTQAEAEAAGVCTFCGKPATEFRNSISRREYQISGFCQACQDSVFGED